MSETRILKLSYNGDGYAQVTLSNNKNRTVFRVHRLVAQAFIPNQNEYETVNHKDENRKNNVVTNLEWLTNADNIRYSQSKKVNQYDLQGNLINTWDCIMDIERSLNIANNLIVRCCRGKYGHKTAGGYKWRYKDAN